MSRCRNANCVFTYRTTGPETFIPWGDSSSGEFALADGAAAVYPAYDGEDDGCVGRVLAVHPHLRNACRQEPARRSGADSPARRLGPLASHIHRVLEEREEH